jgi:acetyl esterase/lipase
VGGTPSQFDGQARELAGLGIVAMLADYRNLKGTPANTPPDVCIQDAKSAIRWVRSHAADLGVDPARIGAGGGSAGGHLAAFTGLAAGLDDPADDLAVSAKPNALVLFNPVFDNGPDGGWGSNRVGKDFAKYSPAHQISKDDPPTIVFLGKKDNLIPVEVVERFAKGMKAVGVRCETHFYDGATHGFFNKEPHKTQTLNEASKFLASLGWIQPKAVKQAP